MAGKERERVMFWIYGGLFTRALGEFVAHTVYFSSAVVLLTRRGKHFRDLKTAAFGGVDGFILS